MGWGRTPHGADEYSVRIDIGVEEQKGSPERGIGSILSASNDENMQLLTLVPNHLSTYLTSAQPQNHS